MQVTCVFSSSAKADGLVRARRQGIYTEVLAQPVDWARVTQTLKHLQVDVIFLAGFMRLLPAEFVNAWQGQMINVHPSLLPAYPGLQSIARAYQDGHPVGVTLHEVIVEMDAGKVLRQGVAVQIPKTMSLENLEYVVHAKEHQLVREVLHKWPMPLMS